MDEIEATSAHPDDELSLPKATVFKMIQEMLPEDVVCGKETRDLLLECCVEFIHLLASQANEICEKTAKKTIAGDHIMQALKDLGFESYLEDVMMAHGEHKHDLKTREAKKSAASKFGDSGMTEEELMKQQEALFNAARAKYQQRISTQSEIVGGGGGGGGDGNTASTPIPPISQPANEENEEEDDDNDEAEDSD